MGIRSTARIKIKSRSNTVTEVVSERPDNPLVAHLRSAAKKQEGYQQLKPKLLDKQKNGIRKMAENLLSHRGGSRDFEYSYQQGRSLMEHLTPEISYSLTCRSQGTAQEPTAIEMKVKDTSGNFAGLRLNFSKPAESPDFMELKVNNPEKIDALLTSLNDLLASTKSTVRLNKYDTMATAEEYRNSPATLLPGDYDSENYPLLGQGLAEFGNASSDRTFLELEFSDASNYNIYHMNNFSDGDDEEDDYYYNERQHDLDREVGFYDQAWRDHKKIFRFTEEQCRYVLSDLPWLVDSFYKKPDKLSREEFYQKWVGLSSGDFTLDFDRYDRDDIVRYMGSLVLKTFKRDIPRREINGYTQDPDFKKHVTVR